MSQSSLLITIGVLTFLVPFAGLPYSAQNILIPIFGIVVFAVGFSMRSKHVETMAAKTEAPPEAAQPSQSTSNIG